MSEKRFVYEEEHYHFPIKKRIRDAQNNETYYDLKDVCDLLNELETRIDLLEKGILDCLFEDKSIGMFALDMGLVYNG